MRDTGPRVNDRIRAPEIRLIGAEGENIGVVTPDRAMQLAEEAGLPPGVIKMVKVFVAMKRKL